MIVWPREGEHWGGIPPGTLYKDPIPMEEMDWYTLDLFGLKSADDAGMHNFESFDGGHTKWSDEDLYGWLDKYFTYI